MAGLNQKLATAFCNLPFILLAALEILIYVPIAMASVFVWITAINRSHDHSIAQLNDFTEKRYPVQYGEDVFNVETMIEPFCTRKIDRQLSDEIFHPENPNSTPNLELIKMDVNQLSDCTEKRYPVQCGKNVFYDQTMTEPSFSRKIERQLSDEISPPNNPNSTPNLELIRMDVDQLELCSKVASYNTAFATPKVYPRSSMIPPEELSKEADYFINNFRSRLRRERKIIKEKNNLEFTQRIERGAL